MTTQPKLLTADRNAMGTTLISQWTSGSGSSTIELYTGTQPTGPSVGITTQTLLGTLTCSSPIGTVSSGVITFNPITQDSSADASGVATWARLRSGDSVAHADWSVSDTSGTGVIKLDNVNVVAGGVITITSFTIELPGV